MGLTKRIFLVIAVLALLFVAIYAGVFLTPAGRAGIKGIVESQLGAALEKNVTIGALGGALPVEIIAKDIEARGDDGGVIRIADFYAVWRPLSLLAQPITIEKLKVGGVYVKAGARPEDADDSEPFSLPESLPKISIPEFSLTDIEIDNGEARTNVKLNAAGSALLDDGRISLRLEGGSDGEFDKLSVTVDRNARRRENVVDISVNGAPGGVIASLAEAQNPIMLEVHGDGPIDEFTMTASLSSDTLGNLAANASGDFLRWRAVNVTGRYAFGAQAAQLAEEIGDYIDFEVDFGAEKNLFAARRLKLASPALSLSGAMETQFQRNEIASLSGTLNASPNKDWRADIQNLIGDSASLEFTAQRINEKQFALSGALGTPKFDIQSKDATLTELQHLNAAIEVTASENAALPMFLSDGFDASAHLSFNVDEMIEFADFALETTGGVTVNGAGDFHQKTSDLAFNGQFSLSPAALTALSDTIASSGAVSGNADISGNLNNLGVDLKASTHALVYNEVNVPPLDIVVKLSNATRAPTGGVRVRARNTNGRFDVDIRSQDDGAVTLQNIVYQSDAFLMTGRADLSADRNGVKADLKYAGEANAQPWPGVTLAGDALIKGDLSRHSRTNTISIASDAISLPGLNARGLDVRGQGPANAFVVEAKAVGLTPAGAPEIEGFETSLGINLQQFEAITIRSLRAVIADNALQLTQPATVNLTDGVSIEGVDATYGRNGRVRLDAAVASSRWRANAIISQAPLAGLSSLLDMTVDLDTNNAPTATGGFSLLSRLNNLEDEKIAGSFVWDGRTFSISDDGSIDGSRFNLKLPLELVRGDAIGVRASGEISGDAKIDERLETIAGFLPAQYQGVEGAFRIDAALSGSLRAPHLIGEASLSGASFTELNSGVAIVGINGAAKANASPDGTSISIAFAGRGPGQDTNTVRLDGKAAIGEDMTLDAKTVLTGLRLSAGPVSEVVADGEITLAGRLDNLRLAGDVAINRLDAVIATPETTGLVPINVVNLDEAELNENGMTTPATTSAPIKLNVAVVAKDKVFVRGRGVESEWQANVAVDGTATNPVILGEMDIRRGWIDFSGRRFDLSRGKIAFDRLSVNNPTLDMKADYEADGVTASIVISGRATEPKISLTSTPTLPSDDIMALVLFGKPATELSAFEALQVAQALAQLGGIGPFGGSGGGVTGAARSALGLDLLNVDVGSDAGASKLTIGKYVADGLFVSATQDARGEEGSVRVEYEITNSISLETELKQTGDQTVSANWKKDF
ncbi:MAG: translocation/assembly module TamB domain-containing protein [Parvularculaceae bacterium]